MKENLFWKWFIANKSRLEDFISSNSDDYSLYEELTNRIAGYNENIIPELTRDSSDNYILILSCDGKKEGIRNIEQLYEAAPRIEKWIIQKYRTPGHVRDLNYQELDVKSKDIRVRYTLSDGYYDIELFMRGYKGSDDRYKGLGFLYLDHLVGEYNVMTKIGSVTFKRLQLFTNTSGTVTLPELRAVVERLN